MKNEFKNEFLLGAGGAGFQISIFNDVDRVHRWQSDAVEGGLGGLDERIFPSGALAPEIVVVDRPEHDAAQVVVHHVLRLCTSID